MVLAEPTRAGATGWGQWHMKYKELLGLRTLRVQSRPWACLPRLGLGWPCWAVHFLSQGKKALPGTAHLLVLSGKLTFYRRVNMIPLTGCKRKVYKSWKSILEQLWVIGLDRIGPGGARGIPKLSLIPRLRAFHCKHSQQPASVSEIKIIYSI